jgi:ring-1,2-phenylacetyl-CoA epoxidase subunit PaaE
MIPKFHTLKISDIKRETEDTVSVAFDVPVKLQEEYSFEPGQHLTLRTTVTGEDIRRSYSLCVSPYEGELRVAIKKMYAGKFSNYANDHFQVGQELEVMTPMGKFNTPMSPDNEKSYVFFAAGSGITPIISLTKTILKDEPKSRITLFYGNKGFASIIFREEIEALKNLHMDRFRIVHILSRESLGNEIQKGRIDEHKMELLQKAFLTGEPIDEVFACGPEEMIHTVKNSMIKQGVDPKHIHYELFTTPGSTIELPKKSVAEEHIESNVTVIIDGESIKLALDSEGESVLDAAFRAGGDLPYACKGGVCCTCKAKIIEGTARMTLNYSLEEDEIAAGYILTCQAHPTSDKLIISFDE